MGNAQPTGGGGDLHPDGSASSPGRSARVPDHPGERPPLINRPHTDPKRAGVASLHTFEQGLESTVRWFLNNLDWCQVVHQDNGQQKSTIQRLGSVQDGSASVSKRRTTHGSPFHARRESSAQRPGDHPSMTSPSAFCLHIKSEL